MMRTTSAIFSNTLSVVDNTQVMFLGYKGWDESAYFCVEMIDPKECTHYSH